MLSNPPLRLRALSLLVLASLALVLLGSGCGHKAETPAATSQAPVIQTVTVKKVKTAAEAQVPGTVRALWEARLAPKIMSKVAAVTVHEGDHVRRGEVLVRLENLDLQAGVAQGAAALKAAQAGEKQAQTALTMQRVTSSVQVQQAEAALQAARANLAKVKQGPRPQQVAQAKQAVERAHAALASAQAELDLVQEGARKQVRAQTQDALNQAQQGLDAAHEGVVAANANLHTVQTDYNRMKALAAQDVIPQQRLDHAALQYQTAQAQLAQAQAAEGQAKLAVQSAQQQVSMVQEGARTQEVKQAEEAVNQANAAYQQAELGLQMAQQGGRKEDVAAAEAGVTQAEQALRNAKSAQARNQVRESDVQMAKASVGQAQAGLQAAEVSLGYSVIKAPRDGVVIARLADPGSMATPGVPLLVIADNSSYRLEASVPENLANYLHLGQTATVSLGSLSARWPVKVTEIVPAAAVDSHTFIVKAQLPRDGRLRSGLFGRLIFPTGERPSILVPETAIWRQGGLTGVFVVSDGRVHLRMVQLGVTRDGSVEVNAGLESGDVVAVNADHLKDDDAVSSASGGQS